jgi:methionyl-tRNA formyltransferase
MSKNIIFMGSPDFAIPTLTALTENYTVRAVVTQPDRRAGRGRTLTPPPVKQKALELGLEVYQPPNLRTPEAFAKLESYAPDLIVVAAFGQILKQNVLDLPPFGCINVHASLLPRWRGASPINAAILHGDAQSGVTIMKMDVGLDTGPVLATRAVPITPDTNAGQLSDTLSELGGELLVETLPDYLDGKITPQPQDDAQATYAPMLSKQDGLLEFSEPAAVLARKVRAFDPWPGTFIYWKDKPLKILQASTANQSREPGRRSVYEGKPAIYTAEGVLILHEVQPAGKRRMSGETFLNGARDWDSN